MRLSRLPMPLIASVLMLALPLFGVAYCQENPAPIAPAATLLSRLKDVKFVGIPRARDDRDGVTLIAMSEEQHTAYRKAIIKSQEFRKEYDEARNAAIGELQEAIRLKESPEVIAKYQQAIDRFNLTIHNKRIRQSNYLEFGANVYGVVSVGVDYVEIASRSPGSTELIPLSEIRRVVFRKDLPKFEVVNEAEEK